MTSGVSVNSSLNSATSMPCGWSFGRGRVIRSTTLTTGPLRCGSRALRICPRAPVGEQALDQAGPVVGEAVVVVAPCGGGEQHVEAGHRRPPGEPLGLLQPLAVLHRL